MQLNPKIIHGLSLLILLLVTPALHADLKTDQKAFFSALRQYTALSKEGRYEESIPPAKRALTLLKRTNGPDDPLTGKVMSDLATFYFQLGRYEEGLSLGKQAAKILLNTDGSDPYHPYQGAVVLNNLASSYRRLEKFDLARKYFKQAMQKSEQIPVLDAVPDARGNVKLGSLNGLSTLAIATGQHAVSLDYAKQAVQQGESLEKPDLNHFAIAYNNLGAAYITVGELTKAEAPLRKSLALNEKNLRPDHPLLSPMLNSLGNLYQKLGRLDEAAVFLGRSVNILEKSLGEHPDVATSLNNLAEIYRVKKDFPRAEKTYQRVLDIYTKTLGKSHSYVGRTLNNMAIVYSDQGENSKSLDFHERALEIEQEVLGDDHPSVLLSMKNVATSYSDLGRHVEADKLYASLLETYEDSYGGGHPLLIQVLRDHAESKRSRNLNNDALILLDRAIHVYQTNANQLNQEKNNEQLRQQRKMRPIFMSHLDTITDVLQTTTAEKEVLITNSFKTGQLAHANSTATAVAQMAARYASDDSALGKLVRQQQEVSAQWTKLNNRYTKMLATPVDDRDDDLTKEVNDKLTMVDKLRRNIETQIQTVFPEYAELTSPTPLALDDFQQLLRSDDAFISYVIGKQHSYIWVVTDSDAAIYKIDMDQRGIKSAVTTLRDAVDPYSASGIGKFNHALSYEFYQRIFLPVEKHLKGIKHLYLVADGALQSLPPALLVSEKPVAGKKPAWLIKKYAFTILPSASTLKALNRFAGASRAEKPFSGIGDPLLSGHPGANRGAKLPVLFDERGVADADTVRSLASLPETATELKTMAAILGASNEALQLREQATETHIKQAKLANYRVLAFATHGLVAGDLDRLQEPALVLTPPNTGTREDDGLLTASEVARLELNADLVILSACNTASTDGTPGADGLSGLTKAFIYAGSRSLLVSHWPVASKPTVALTTELLKSATSSSTPDYAEALRQSMLALMNKKGFEHPIFWAPFVMVGQSRQ